MQIITYIERKKINIQVCRKNSTNARYISWIFGKFSVASYMLISFTPKEIISSR